MEVRAGAEMDALLNAIDNSVTQPGNGCNATLPSLGQMSTYSYLLPASALSAESPVVDKCVKDALEPQSLINWCSTFKRVQPVCTKGDGNCLLHAVSLSMWGIHDSRYDLRQLVRDALMMNAEPIRKRWQSQLEKEHSAVPGGCQLTEQQWQQEWDTIVRLVSDVDGREQTYNNVHPLEAIHVFVVANILRRPILVYGKADVVDSAGYSLSANNIVGAYLPLLCPASECTRTPILLTFHNGHFVPLLSVVDSESEAASGRAVRSVHRAPLVLHSLEQLRVHFLLDDDELPRDLVRSAHDLLRDYFDLDDVPFTQIGSVRTILCAKLNHIQLPASLRIALPQPPSQISAASAHYWPLPAAQLLVGSVSLSGDGCAAPGQDRTAAATSGVAAAFGGYDSTAVGDAECGQQMLPATGLSPGALSTASSEVTLPAVPLAAVKCVHLERTDHASADCGGLCKECYDITCEAERMALAASADFDAQSVNEICKPMKWAEKDWLLPDPNATHRTVFDIFTTKPWKGHTSKAEAFSKQMLITLVYRSRNLKLTLPERMKQEHTYRTLEKIAISTNDASMFQETSTTWSADGDTMGNELCEQLVQHMRAAKYLFGSVDRPLTVDVIKETHKLLMTGAIEGYGQKKNLIKAGKFRVDSCFAHGHEYPDPKEVPEKLPKIVDNFNKSITECDNNTLITAPARLFYDTITLHPFQDGNGRLCRLLFAFAVLKAGVPFPVQLSTGHRKARKHYMLAIFRARRGKMDELHTMTLMSIDYVLRKFLEEYPDIAPITPSHGSD